MQLVQLHVPANCKGQWPYQQQKQNLSQPLRGAKDLLWPKCLLGELGGKVSEVLYVMIWVFEIINGCAAYHKVCTLFRI